MEKNIKKLFKRITSMVLAVMIFVGAVPAMPLTAYAATAVPDDPAKLVDNSTANDWKNIFYSTGAADNKITTANAGAVWTDKSVFKTEEEFMKMIKDATGDDFGYGHSTGKVSADEFNLADNSFLVSLSAMAANETVVGRSAAPTDTMIILDISSSMYNGTSLDPSTLQTMFEAVNDTITSLQALHQNNRVGISVYFGRENLAQSTEAHSMLLLPLDRYTPVDGKYVKVNTKSGKLEGIQVVSGVKNSSGSNASVVKYDVKSIAGTYAQMGILHALKQFMREDISDKATVGSMKVDRTPVFLFMSDGEPTAASVDYTTYPDYNHSTGTDVDGIDRMADMGNNQVDNRNPAETDFLTQLTAAYAKAVVDEKYVAKTPLFYTLSLGTSISLDVMDPKGNDATSEEILKNPSAYTSTQVAKANENRTIVKYWEDLLDGDNKATVNTTILSATLSNPFGNSKVDKNFTVNRVDKITSAAQKYYVDKHFTAANASNLSEEFTKIVSDIGLQSKYFPTLVKDNENLEGYISFVDKIGEYMNVTEIKGLVIGDKLYTGASFASKLNTGALGTVTEATDLGDELVWSIEQRLGNVDADTVRTLIDNAYNAGQLSYTSDTEYSNYVGWYANADDEFIGFWKEGAALPEKTGDAKKDPAFYVKSYIYLGETDGDHHIADSDMMYATVRWRKNIETGEESVAFAVPAALIPTVTYNIKLNESYNLESLSRQDATPIRLVYEVSLDSAITADTVLDVVSSDYINAKGNKDGEGNIYFYTNQYDVENKTGYGTDNAYSYFAPSRYNSKYYYQQNELVYSNNTGSLYKGDSAPTAGFRRYTVFEKDGSALKTNTVYRKLSDAALGTAVKNTDGTWYIPQGNVHVNLDGFIFDKTENITDTITRSNESFVDTHGGAIPVNQTTHNFVVGSTLGNNGRMAVKPSTGIVITKVVDSFAAGDGAAKEFTFVVTRPAADTAAESFAVTKVAKDGTKTAAALEFAAGSTAAEIKLKDGETAYISGMTAGKTYTVSEKFEENYVVSDVKVDGESQSAGATDATVTTVTNKLVKVQLNNAPRGKGQLTVSKYITNEYGSLVSFPEDLKFEFTVTFKLNGAELKGEDFAVTTGESTVTKTTDDNGKFTFELKDTESAQIADIPEGTEVTVAETANPQFKTSYKENGEDGDGIVVVKRNIYESVAVYNEYIPDDDINVPLVITGEKTVKNAGGDDKWADEVFKVQLQRREGDSWVTFAEREIKNEDGKRTFDFSAEMQAEKFTKPGVYAYQLVEFIPADADRYGHIVYDRTEHTFSITVADLNGDGKLEISAVRSNHTATDIPFADGKYEITADLKNEYVNYIPAVVTLKLNKAMTNDSDSPVPTLNGYRFGIYDDAECTGTPVATTEPTDTVGETSKALTFDVGENAFEDGDEVTYYIKEIDDGKQSISYSSDIIKVVITFADGGSGKLVGTPKYFKGDSEIADVVFTNEYKVAETTASFGGTKTLEGKALKDGDYKFEVKAVTSGAPMPAQAVVANSGANFRFGDITFDKVGTYSYTVSEVIPSEAVDNRHNGVEYDTTVYNVHVTVTDTGKDADGCSCGRNHLAATVSVDEITGTEMPFTNDYTADPVEVTIDGTKKLEGRDMFLGEFTFELYETDENYAIPSGAAPVQSVQNNADGTFTFAPIKYEPQGYDYEATFYYVVKEKIPEGADSNNVYNGVTYDAAEYRVAVEVEDDYSGELDADIIVNTVKDGDITFSNKYTAREGKISIPGTKTLTGKTLANGMFSFRLEAVTEDAPMPDKTTVANTGSSFSFKDIRFTKAGTYTYKVSEVLPAGINEENRFEGTTYDTSSYTVEITVTDNLKKGELEPVITGIYTATGAIAENVAFTNVYEVRDKTEITIAGQKKITGMALEDGAFTFELYKADDRFEITDSTPLLTTTNDQHGNIVFDTIHYKGSDVGNHYYVVKEKVPAEAVDNVLNGITYDTREFCITVNVADNGRDDLTANITSVAAKGAATRALAFFFTFENSYNTEDVSVVLDGTKTLTGRDFTQTDIFEFGLYEAAVAQGDEMKAWTVGRNLQNVSTTAADLETFKFAEIKYETTGTYYYVVKETVPAVKAQGITYDSTEYLYKVVVEDNGYGALVADKAVVAKRTPKAEGSGYDYAAATAAAFTNTFTPEPVTIAIDGVKILTGDSREAVKAGEFTFELYETGENFVIPQSAAADKVTATGYIGDDNTVDLAADTKAADANSNGVADEFGFAAKAGDKNDIFYFDAPETRYYVVKEQKGEDKTITYSPIEHNFKVVVTKNQSTGILSAHIEEVKTKLDSVTITNVYETKEASTVIGFRKYLENKTGVEIGLDTFKFGVYTDENCKTAYKENGEALVITADKNGYREHTFTFTDADYKVSDKYVYYLKEIPGTVPGMTYDKTVYKLTITLTFDSENNLVATPVLEKVGTSSISAMGGAPSLMMADIVADFYNKYELTKTDIKIEGEKSFTSLVSGWVWEDEDTFTIELYKTDAGLNYVEGRKLGEAVISNTNKTFSFTSTSIPELEFTSAGTYYFVVREIHGGKTIDGIVYTGKEYAVVVTVAKGDNGDADALENNLVATVKTHLVGHDAAISNYIVFANEYSIPDDSVQQAIIKAKKFLEGRNIVDHEFNFELYEATADASGRLTIKAGKEDEPLKATTNTGNTVTFPAISYNALDIGEHYYIIKEADTHNPTITYSSDEYGVKVVVDDEDGKLKTPVITYMDINGNAIGAEQVEFKNTYRSQSVEVIVPIEKEFVNNTGVTLNKDNGGKFEFGLYTDAACTNLADKKEIVLSGNAEFKLTYTDTDVPAGKAYLEKEYYLKEIVPDTPKPGMIYDDTVYKVYVKVGFEEVDEDNNPATPAVVKLTAKTEITRADDSRAALYSATFSNKYELAHANVVIEGRKELAGHDALKSDFMFRLYKADSSWNIDSSAEPLRAANDYKVDPAAPGEDYDKFVFASIPYSKAGTYHYVVKEEKGSLGGVTYDDSEYRVTVTVTADDSDADNDGKYDELIADVDVAKVDAAGNAVTATDDLDENGIVDIEFNNSYVPAGKLSVSGSKEIAGRDWREGDSFGFEIYLADSSFNPVDADGDSTNGVTPAAEDDVKFADTDRIFEFVDIALTGEVLVDGNADNDKFYFVVKEKAGSIPAMEYDTREYRVTVAATDNKDGTITFAAPVIEVGTQTTSFIFFTTTQWTAADEIKFVNRYITEPTAVTFKGTKALTGSLTGRTIKDGEFTFELYSAAVDASGVWTKDTLVKSVENKGTEFVFAGDYLKLSQLGTSYFVVTEKAGENSIVGYDDTEHRIKVVVEEADNAATPDKAELKATVYYVAEDGSETEITETVKLESMLGFENSYNDTEVVIEINKDVLCEDDAEHGKGGFEFQLVRTTDNKKYEKAVSDSNGNTSYTLRFDERDIGKTYTYQLTEIDQGEDGMEYDETVFEFVIVLTADNATDSLVATITQNGTAVSRGEVNFYNTYDGETPPPPEEDDPGKDVVVETGDISNIGLYGMAMTLSAAVIAAIFIWRRKKDDETENNA